MKSILFCLLLIEKEGILDNLNNLKLFIKEKFWIFCIISSFLIISWMELFFFSWNNLILFLVLMEFPKDNKEIKRSSFNSILLNPKFKLMKFCLSFCKVITSPQKISFLSKKLLSLSYPISLIKKLKSNSLLK